MFGWAARILMVAAGTVTAWFTAKDAPIFGVVQVMVAISLITLVVAVLAFWPEGRTLRKSRTPAHRRSRRKVGHGIFG